ISWPDGTTRKVTDLETTDGYTHTLFMSALPSHLTGPVFDELYGNDIEFFCRENSRYCEDESNACSSDADCASGVCKPNKEIVQKITFAVDEIAPVTDVSVSGFDPEFEETRDISGKRRIDSRDGDFDGKYYHNGNVTVSLGCHDVTIDENFPSLYAGCSEIRYCTVGISNDGSDDLDRCDPDRPYEAPVIIEDSSTLCYLSEDAVGNIEETVCRSFYIDRTKPDLDIEFITPVQKGTTYFTEDSEISFSASVVDQALSSYEIILISPQGRDSTILRHDMEDSATPSVRPAGFSSTQEGSSLDILGRLTSLTVAKNGYGPNTVRLTARDRYGNEQSQDVELYYDVQSPLVKEFRVNGETNPSAVPYETDLDFKFFLDDVFWSNDVSSVTAKVYSTETSRFSSDYSFGPVELSPVQVHIPEPTDETIFDEEMFDYVQNVFFLGPDVEQSTSTRLLDQLAEWKEYVFTIPSDPGDSYLYEPGVGEYVLEITAKDSFGRTMTERLFFNITDESQPEIFLTSPEAMIGDEGVPEYRRRVSNNLNQQFVVETPGQPSYCYFDLGSEPTIENLMTPVSGTSRQKHVYTLRDFEPFDQVNLPFVISCTEHGTQFKVEQFTLAFDRSAVTPTLSINRGIRNNAELIQSHIIEQSLDYGMRSFSELRPVIAVNESKGKRISCSYECVSPNAECPAAEGVFSAPDTYLLEETLNLNLESTLNPYEKPYAYGDYLYDIVCTDQAGNMGKAQQLALSVRTPSAPQKPVILANSEPADGAIIYKENVTFHASTNMLMRCTLDFESSSIETQVMEGVNDDASMQHSATVTFGSSGTYRYQYICSLAADPRVQVKSPWHTISVSPSNAEIQSESVSQVRIGNDHLPILKLDTPSDVRVMEYASDETFQDASQTFFKSTLVDGSFVPGEDIHLRGIDRGGQPTDTIIYKVSNTTMSPSP
ncbi:MAG: hypothetical protein ACOC32_05060, partial [Nanoarchaeota archaeon]